MSDTWQMLFNRHQRPDNLYSWCFDHRLVLPKTSGPAWPQQPACSPLPPTTHKASVVYTTYSADDHWRQGNQEGPRRIHACTDLLRQKLLTASDLPDQARAPSRLSASAKRALGSCSMHMKCHLTQHVVLIARRYKRAQFACSLFPAQHDVSI